MPAFQVLATNHTSFTVSDLDRSIALTPWNIQQAR